MRKAVYVLVVVFSSVAMYRYRYRVWNGLLSIRPLRRWLVKIGMSVPSIRKLIVSQVIREV
ncbi:MAG: hypothetical protein K6T72_12185 [Anoxybacillus sp.]|nr:hypothetical protein [Anoxybacillus sp.]MCL6587245.1 hypothetical protein [Anoxybacillus sp.]